MKTAPAILAVLLSAADVSAAGTRVWNPEAERAYLDADSLDDCDRVIEQFTESPEGYDCYPAIAVRHQIYPEARRRMEARLAVTPDNHLARLYLGWLQADQGMPAAVTSYQEALAGFERERDTVGQVFARGQLAFWYFYSGDPQAAYEQLREAEPLAVESGEPLLLARVRYIEGFFANRRNDYEGALLALKVAEEAAFPEGPVAFQSLILRALAFSNYSLWRLRPALVLYEREADLLAEHVGVARFASLRLNIALTAASISHPRSLGRDEICSRSAEALETARDAKQPFTLMGALMLEAQACRSGAERIELLEELLSVRATVTRPIGTDPQMLALGLLATERAREPGSKAAEVERLLDRALALAEYEVDRREVAKVFFVRARALSELGRREAAVAEGLRALDTIERIRDLQVDATARARSFSGHVEGLSSFASFLLAGRTETDIERAVEVLERIQARTLLDQLDVARATSVLEPDHPAVARRREILDQVASVQRELVGGRLDARARRERLDRLQRLELAELAARREIARADPTFASVRNPRVPELGTIQSALATDQRLLMFLLVPPSWEPEPVWPRQSWLVAIGPEDVDTYPLDVDRDSLSEEIELYLALLKRRDGLADRAGERLRQQLLDPLLSQIDPGVRQLIVVPSGPTHQLPLAVLPAANGEPLAARFAISRTPSATTWLALREIASTEVQEALILADPETPVIASATAALTADSVVYRAGRLGEWPELAPLEYARREGRSMRRRLGEAAELLEGPDATESAFKSKLEQPRGLVHLAAHAVVDSERPDRSSIVLRAGSDEEDGLLQMREIVELDLRGSVVLLSTCESAAGLTLQGEGVLGLSRAFFIAGARAVVGSLWPLRDAETSELVDEMGRHLAAGASVGDALQRARERSIARGRPAMDWAALVVLGDADAAPFPGGTTPDPDRRWLWGLVSGIAVALVLVAAGWRRLRRAA